MAAGLVEQVRVVDREAALGVAEHEHVGEPVDVHAVDRPHAVRPVLRERHAVRSDDVVAGTPGVVGADLEPGGEDEAVELVFASGDDDAARRDPVDAASVGVDQRARCAG